MLAGRDAAQVLQRSALPYVAVVAAGAAGSAAMQPFRRSAEFPQCRPPVAVAGQDENEKRGHEETQQQEEAMANQQQLEEKYRQEREAREKKEQATQEQEALNHALQSQPQPSVQVSAHHHEVSPVLHRRLAEFVRIALPADQYECEGIYCLEHGQRANGQPVWINALRTRCIYQCPAGRWHIAGDDVMDDGFVDSFGWLSQSVLSHGRLPYEVGSPWQRWNGLTHVVDFAVRVEEVVTSECAPQGSRMQS